MNTIYQLTVELCDVLKANYAKRGSGAMEYNYVIEPGRKFFKIIQVNNQRSVHAFVDKKTGDLYKAASWRAPAKGVRYNLINDMNILRKNADWAGSYLYR